MTNSTTGIVFNTPPAHLQCRNKIITELFNNPGFTEAINKAVEPHLRDDLRSEVMLVLLQQPPGRIELLQRNGKLLFFAVRTVFSMGRCTNDKFAKTFRCGFLGEEYIPPMVHEEVNGRVAAEAAQEPIYALLKKISPLAYSNSYTYVEEVLPYINRYKQNMLSLYMKIGSYKKMEHETKIPRESCKHAVREAIKELRQLATTL